ncbi:MAG TPA: hypothetical protein PLV68_16050, partial [Ilumatobacteraceae bacterium]|nr:hypothetical protein [Ilumatobacteraceae bacterium]
MLAIDTASAVETVLPEDDRRGGRIVPLSAPVRLLDTRPGHPTVDGQHAGGDVVGAGVTIEVPILGR